MKFECQCGKHIRVPDGSEGKKGKCPRCNCPIVVPTSQPDNDTAVPVQPTPPHETHRPSPDGQGDGLKTDTQTIEFDATEIPANGKPKVTLGRTVVLLSILGVSVCFWSAIVVGAVMVFSGGDDETNGGSSSPTAGLEILFHEDEGEGPSVQLNGRGKADGASPGYVADPKKNAIEKGVTPEIPAQKAAGDVETPPDDENTAKEPPSEKPTPPQDEASADPGKKKGEEGTPEASKKDPLPKDAKDPKERPETDPSMKEELDRALETRWFIHRRTWSLPGFLKYVKTFLDKYGKTHGWGSIRFAIEEDAPGAVGAKVVIELIKEPLLEAVEQICRQLNLKYSIDYKTGTVGFTRKGKGRSPGPRKGPQVKEKPRWRKAPHKASKEETKQLEIHLGSLKEVQGRGIVPPACILILRIGKLRTLEALQALKSLASQQEDDSPYTRFLIEAMAEVDGADAAQAMIVYLDKGPYFMRSSARRYGITALNTREAAEVFSRAGLFHKKRYVRLKSAEVLGRIGWDEDLRSLGKAARCAYPKTKLAALEALRCIGSPAALELLVQILTKSDPSFLTSVLNESSQDNPAFLMIARNILKRHNPLDLRMAALRIIKTNTDAASLGLVLKLLNSKDWRVRLVAINTLGEIHHRDAVPGLINRLRHEKGRLAYATCLALKKLTGIDFGLKAEIWDKWWKKYGTAFLPPPILSSKQISHLTSAPAYYHNIPILSNRIVFIIDISGSMMAAARWSNPPEGAPEGGTRLDYCRWELFRTISALSPDVWYNIVAFESSVHAWRKTIVPASLKNRAGAKKFLDRLNPMGGTELFQALKMVFKDRHVDTLYVLSDGSPTGGPHQILKWVSENNRTRMLVIHTISVGGSRRGFMKDLAEQNGGKAVELK